MKQETERLQKAKRIDSTSHIAAARVWLFSGTRDRTVYPAVVEGLKGYYALHGVKALLVDGTAAGHAMPTEDVGNRDCAVTDEPYINDCDYDAAGEILKHLLGSLKDPSPASNVVAFDQAPYAADAGMGGTGFLYVPPDCKGGGCRVHVAFHGCRQSAEHVGEAFVRNAGYNRWAASNRLIVLYPQAEPSWSPFGFNPRGCWDWWGYSGADYHTREGAQIKAVMAMIRRLGSAAD